MNNQLSSYKKIKNLFEQYPELEYDKLCYYIGICNTKEDVSDEETLKLMAICDKCCAFLTGCYTGMRTGEVFALTWDDINLDKRIININKTVYAKDKEESGRWYLGTTKKSDSQREVYICDSLYAVLIAYKNIQNNLKRQYGKKYKRYILEEVKNKFGKLVEYKIVESLVLEYIYRHKSMDNVI